jgi:hypothetical protein
LLAHSFLRAVVDDRIRRAVKLDNDTGLSIGASTPST